MTEWLHDFLLAPLTEVYFLKALIGGSVVAMVCSVVGCLVILRRMAFLGDALSHAMIAGVVGGYLFMKVLFGVEANVPAMLIGSLIAAVVTVALIGFVSRASRLKRDTVIGIMYCGIFAFGIVLLTIFQQYVHIDIMHFIMGDILGISDTDLWLTVIVAATVLTVIILFFRYFQITSFDAVMAASIGIPVMLFEYILTTCMSFVVVSAVSMVGVILSVGLLITPAATAYLLTDRLNRMMVLSAVFGFTSVVGGMYLSVWLDAASGVSIMLFCSVQFMAVLITAPRYGVLANWRRRRRMIPQVLMEDILRAILKEEPDGIGVGQLANTVHEEASRVSRALRSMSTDGLLNLRNNRVLLTDPGRVEAKKIMRAHRLWETYLQHVGTPLPDIHGRAHQLEHLHDEKTVDFIDDLLGHPLHDPHGSPIPDDFLDTTEGQIASVSLLRSGRHGTIRYVHGQAAERTDLKPGDNIRMGDRADDGETWTIVRDDGKEFQLDHETADAILIQIQN
jgi:manganese/iron transport system permease protein/iron/zinc/copper transport system permease protein